MLRLIALKTNLGYTYKYLEQSLIFKIMSAANATVIAASKTKPRYLLLIQMYILKDFDARAQMVAGIASG